MGEAMATCPLSLLYKDRKGWSGEMGGCPPTRPVAGGHLGMNLHLSEVVSDLVEPLVDRYIRGRECITIEDMLARFNGMNEDNKNWTRWSWYEGQTCEEYMGCGVCIGDWTNTFDVEKPELCECSGVVTMGYSRVTARWMKQFRRTKWAFLH